jgi:hypothetical protein
MAWINLAATQYRYRTSARDLLTKWEATGNTPAIPSAPALYALLAGDPDLTEAAIRLTLPLLAPYRRMNDETLLRPLILPDAASILVVAHLGGEESPDLWRRIALATPRRTDPVIAGLQQIAARLTGSTVSPTKAVRPQAGTVASTAEWSRLLKDAPAAYLLDQALAPDHHLWASVLRLFVLPLALLAAREATAGSMGSDPRHLLHSGSHPERHTAVLYERTRPRPQFDVEPLADQQDTWAGFDAVEFQGDHVIAYHYMGLKWQAPLVFDGDLNAFRFLDQLDLSWQLVHNAVAGEVWRAIEARKNAGRCVHVVVYDERVAESAPEDLQRAASHYGINLRAADLTQV